MEVAFERQASISAACCRAWEPEAEGGEERACLGEACPRAAVLARERPSGAEYRAWAGKEAQAVPGGAGAMAGHEGRGLVQAGSWQLVI